MHDDRQLHRGAVAALVLALATAGVSGCVGSGIGLPNDEPDPEAVPETYEEIQTMIFDPLCAQQCHKGGAAPKGLTLEARSALRLMVGVPSVEVPQLQRIEPGNAEASYLVIKLKPTDPRRVGSRMPRNGPPFVSGGQIRAIQRWIRAGATDDWIDEEVDAGVPLPPTPADGGAE